MDQLFANREVSDAISLDVYSTKDRRLHDFLIRYCVSTLNANPSLKMCYRLVRRLPGCY